MEGSVALRVRLREDALFLVLHDGLQWHPAADYPTGSVHGSQHTSTSEAADWVRRTKDT